jgi:hypothetical protein
MNHGEMLTPQSPRWNDFISLLDDAVTACGCTSGRQRRLARGIMAQMGGINIEASLIFFDSHGGFCDCEIIFNVEESDRFEKLNQIEERI